MRGMKEQSPGSRGLHDLLLIHLALNCGSLSRARDCPWCVSLDVTLLSLQTLLGEAHKAKICLQENCIFATPGRVLWATLVPIGFGFSSSVQMHLHCSLVWWKVEGFHVIPGLVSSGSKHTHSHACTHTCVCICLLALHSHQGPRRWKAHSKMWQV